jgi:hypothetical protein
MTTFPSEPNYYEIQREIDLNHDKIVAEFQKRSDDWDRHRREIDQVGQLSMQCFRVIMTLHQKGLISHDIFSEFMLTDGWTAYLPIEVGTILKQVQNSGDGYLIHMLYKT